jgi:hypothetical protein
MIVGLLADNAPHNTGPDFGKASPVGLLIVVLLLIATYFLIWSMNRHLKKLPKSFVPPDTEDTENAKDTEDTEDTESGESNEPGG